MTHGERRLPREGPPIQRRVGLIDSIPGLTISPVVAEALGVAQPSLRRKWTPSTIASTDVTDTPRARTTAASSPGPRTILLASAVPASSAAIDSISERSAMIRSQRCR